MNDKFTTVRITRAALDVLRDFAKQDTRSTVMELELLISQELIRRNNKVIRVEELPHPPDGEVVPLVYVKG